MDAIYSLAQHVEFRYLCARHLYYLSVEKPLPVHIRSDGQLALHGPEKLKRNPHEDLYQSSEAESRSVRSAFAKASSLREGDFWESCPPSPQNDLN